MGREFSLPRSQQPTICPNLMPDQSTSRSLLVSWKPPCNTTLPFTPIYSSLSLSFRFPIQISVCTSPLPHMCPHVPNLILLDLINRNNLHANRKLPLLLSDYFKVTQFFTQAHDTVGKYLCIRGMQSGVVVYLIKMNNSTSKTNPPQLLYW